MARINIDDDIFIDVRFDDLLLKLGSRIHALGALVQAWMVAQKFCDIENPRALVPIDEWKKQRVHEAIIEVGLAKIEGEFVYVCGAEEQFAWLVVAKVKGRKGGLARLSPASKKPSPANPLTLPPSLPPKEKNKIKKETPITPPEIASDWPTGKPTEKLISLVERVVAQKSTLEGKDGKH